MTEETAKLKINISRNYVTDVGIFYTPQIQQWCLLLKHNALFTVKF